MAEPMSVATRHMKTPSDVVLTSPSLSGTAGREWMIAPPGLPLVIGAGRFLETCAYTGIGENRVQLPDACAHALGLRRADAQPEDVHFLRERRGIREHAVVVALEVEVAASDERAGRTAESPDVREEVEVIERDV